MENQIICPPPLVIKYVKTPISMALEEIDEILKKMLREYGIMIQGYNKMINLDRLCDPSTLSRKSLSDVRFALDRYIPDSKMMDSSMKTPFYEAVAAFYVYEKFYFIYKDCFQYGFKNILNRAEEWQSQALEGKATPKKMLAMENFQKILAIAKANVEEYPKLIKLKDIAPYYLYGFLKKIIFANNATAPHLKTMLNAWGLETEIVSSSKGVKKLSRLKNGDLKCLIFTSEPKIKLEIDRMMIIHYTMPTGKEDSLAKNACNGSIAPEIVFYIHMDHFLDARLKRASEIKLKSPKKKKGQGTLDLW